LAINNIRYIGKKPNANGMANITRRPVDTNDVTHMREDMAINASVEREAQQMRIIVMLMQVDGKGNPMVESLLLQDMSHLPRVGDTVCYRGTYYEVCEVTWDYGMGEVVVDAWIS
jgi:hypothetical protein